jgi:hypothetical protein
MAIANYDAIAMELKVFGESIYLDIDFLAREKKFHIEGEQHLTPKKTLMEKRWRWPVKYGGKRHMFPGTI